MSERATYQSLLDRGFDEEDAYESALDGVDVQTLRDDGIRYCRECAVVVSKDHVHHD
jgi:hypothetical protein